MDFPPLILGGPESKSAYFGFSSLLFWWASRISVFGAIFGTLLGVALDPQTCLSLRQKAALLFVLALDSVLKLKIILTTPTPHICKKYAPKICHAMGVCMA